MLECSRPRLSQARFQQRIAVFQVAGNDARALVWELGKERMTEDDITSLPVHHCYVRATDW